MTLGFLGAGKMATAIAGGIANSGILGVADMIACDTQPQARERFEVATGVACKDDPACLAGIEVLVLAVKPQYARDAVASLPDLRGNILVVSIAAGIQLATLADWFGSDRIIRVMPNTPLLVGKGASVFAAGAGATEADTELTTRIFGSVGLVRQADEGLIDAVTALSGSGPAYVFEMAQALADAGCSAGLDQQTAMELTIQTLAGAAEMLVQGVGTPEELRDAVTSPGGTTEAGLAVMHDANLRDLMQRVVAAAKERSIELGKQ